MGLKVTAIDLSEVRIAEAQNRARDLGLEIEFLVGDAEQLDIPSETFDAVHCAAILHHRPHVDRDLVQLRDLLRPGGSFLAMEPGLLNPFAFLRRRFFPTSVHTPDERPFIPAKFFAMFRQRFRIVECRHFYILSLVAPIVAKIAGRRAGSLVLGPTAAVDELLCRLPIVRELAWYLDVHAIK
jgi:ubiquinone/menaquinone biosynthesis C-methylase UbiE